MKKTALDARTKWSYCIGATGRDMAYALVSMYLITYIQYTMKLTVAQFGVISLCVVLCLIWDAINDPMMGIIIENSHFKSGKYRPWILCGVLLNAVIIILLFTVRPQGWAFVAFFGVGYLLWGMTFTMNDIAYWGMLPSLSSDPATRNTLVTLMSIFICIGQFSVAGVVPVIVAGNAVNAYRFAALVVALCFVGFQLLTFFGVKERPRKDNEEHISLKGMFGILRRNDQLMAAGVASFLFNIASNLLIVFGVNFFYFEFGYAEGGSLVFIFTVMYGLGTLLSQACYAALTARFSRMTLLWACVLLLSLGYLMMLGFGYVLPKNVVLLNIIGFGIFWCQGLCNLIIVVMLNNTIEYDEYRFQERHDSVISAVRSFSVKLASAANQGISALVLVLSGIYAVSQKITDLEIEAGRGSISSEAVLSQANGYVSAVLPWQTLVLRIGMVAVPIVMILSCYFLLKKHYHIDEKEYTRIVDEIAKNRNNAPMQAEK